MTGANVLVELVVVLGTAAVITLLFQALRLPVVLGYVVAGLLIGSGFFTRAGFAPAEIVVSSASRGGRRSASMARSIL